MNFNGMWITGDQQQALLFAIGAFVLSIIIVYFEIRSGGYRPGCYQCAKAQALEVEQEKEKALARTKSDQRIPPGAGSGGGWRV